MLEALIACTLGLCLMFLFAMCVSKITRKMDQKRSEELVEALRRHYGVKKDAP